MSRHAPFNFGFHDSLKEKQILESEKQIDVESIEQDIS
jgi:hypothetical protein